MARGIFIGGSGSSVLRWSIAPIFMVGRCGKCGRESECKHVRMGIDSLEGEFICDCGTRATLTVSLGFRKVRSRF